MNRLNDDHDALNAWLLFCGFTLATAQKYCQCAFSCDRATDSISTLPGTYTTEPARAGNSAADDTGEAAQSFDFKREFQTRRPSDSQPFSAGGGRARRRHCQISF
jgi:hypothetical protein